MKMYCFHRDTGYYPLELKGDNQAWLNAVNNPGITKVVEAETGRVVWEFCAVKASQDALARLEESLKAAQEGVDDAQAMLTAMREEMAKFRRRISAFTPKEKFCHPTATPKESES